MTGPTSTPPSDARDTDFTTLTPPANGRASAKANGTITGDHGINGSNGNGNNGNGNGGSNPSSTGTPPATTASAAAPSSHDPAAGTTSQPATSDAPMPRPRRYRIETGWASLTKRTIDLAVAIPLMAVTVVAFPWIALAIKITSRGP
ncbi:MAG: hypothetical protein KDB03_29130, partial [Planctomycetales bacterium]|nr:hypothetical protein [Planctomycetales bacterium]